MQKRQLLPGKLRGLSQCANAKGVFNILALDHRQAVKKVFQSEADPYAGAVAFKQSVVKALAPVSTAFLLDPSIGAGPSVVSGALPGSTGLVVTVEASGYLGPEHERVSRLPSDWGVSQIKRMNASAVKLLVYFHHKSPTASAMKELVSSVDEECKRLDIPLFLEILTYSPTADHKLDSSERIDAVVTAAAELSPLGGDVLKVEFPVDAKAVPETVDWEAPCRELNDASKIPWVLLSAGVNFDVFAKQTEVVCRAGASGILAGRAIWKEALELPSSEWDNFLLTTAQQRMLKLQEVCDSYAQPYTNFVESYALAEDWYGNYLPMKY
ncbi:MAG TPA: hypothetical protein DDZ66_14675 [Firmicutes bacterium]|jgi:tagatose-1,6-bisphosphate aldolase|nr:hypothetical protein [Bacillota bacterium]